MNFPNTLWLIRHGESTANIVRHKAEADKLPTIDFPEREPDVPLSEAGIEQAVALGRWLKFQKEKPTVIYSSPYLRASETARIITENAKLANVKTFYDERLRERELGIFDRLTKLGAMEKYAEECAKREELGKFYYRPIGGESWVDVALRVRSFWRDLREMSADEKVLIVTHEVVIRVFRYILENLTEAEIMAIDRACDIENCAVTSYHFDADGNKLSLKLDNHLP
ncbi:MAG: histidine phosphatase family protein [Actinomycetota bacterium]